jgi:hypothetical protein
MSLSSSQQEQQIPIPFEKPYHKPSYLYVSDVSNRFIKMKSDDGESTLSKFEGYVLVAGTDNILYKMENKNHIFLQICTTPYTGREYAEAQAIRAKKLTHLDFLSRQLHEGNKEAILQQMQLVLNTTPSKAALERLGQLQQEMQEEKQKQRQKMATTTFFRKKVIVIGVYQIIIPSDSMVALQQFAFINGSNNYTNLYSRLKLNQKKKQNNTKKKYYPMPIVRKRKFATEADTSTSTSTKRLKTRAVRLAKNIELEIEN